MPEVVRKVEVVDALDRQYVYAALVKLEESLKRSLNREFPGSELARLRSEEIGRIVNLKEKFR